MAVPYVPFPFHGNPKAYLWNELNRIAAALGAGGITSISQGTGITLTPNPITTVGTIAITAGGVGPTQIDLAANYPWTGQHTFANALSLFGTTTSVVLGSAARVQQFGTTDGLAAHSMVRGSNDASAPRWVLGKTRSTTYDFLTPVQDADELGRVVFMGADGAAFISSAHLRVFADGAVTPSSGIVTGNMRFVLCDAAGNLTEQFRFRYTGAIGLGGANYGTAGQILVSAGGAAPVSWSSSFTSTTSGGGTAAGLRVVAAQAALNLYESDAAVDAKSWDWFAEGGGILFRTINDANSSARTVWGATRSGIAVVTCLYGNSTDYPTHTLFGDVIIQDNSFAQTLHYNAGGAADAKRSRWAGTGNLLYGSLIDDAFSAEKKWIEITRSGYTPTAIVYGNSVDLPTHTFQGKVIAASTIRLKAYTVATLPAGTQGDTAYVTNALGPAFGVAVAGGGAVVVPVFYDGANWIVA